MANDFFGYNKQVYGPNDIVSYNKVIVSVGGYLCLTQSVNVNYQRQVQPNYELGSDSVWLVAGASSGTCDISRALGRSGTANDATFWSAFKPSDACSATTIKIAQGSGTCGMSPGALTMNNAVLTNVGMQASVGNLVITESANYTIGGVSS